MANYSFELFSRDLDRISDLYFCNQNEEADELLIEVDRKISTLYRRKEFWTHLKDGVVSLAKRDITRFQAILAASKDKCSKLLAYRSVKYLTDQYFEENNPVSGSAGGSPNPHRFFIHWDLAEDKTFDPIFQRELGVQVDRAIWDRVDSVRQGVYRAVYNHPKIAIAATVATYICWPGLSTILGLTAAYGIIKLYQNLGNGAPLSPKSPPPKQPGASRVPVPGLRFRECRI